MRIVRRNLWWLVGGRCTVRRIADHVITNKDLVISFQNVHKKWTKCSSKVNKIIIKRNKMFIKSEQKASVGPNASVYHNLHEPPCWCMTTTWPWWLIDRHFLRKGRFAMSKTLEGTPPGSRGGLPMGTNPALNQATSTHTQKQTPLLRCGDSPVEAMVDLCSHKPY